MQRKLHAIRETKILNPVTTPNDNILQEPSKEEPSDWPHELLAIGTFGNKNVKEFSENCTLHASELSQDHSQDNARDKFGNLQKEINTISGKKLPEFDSEAELDSRNIILDKSFKSSSTLDINRTSSYTISDDIGDVDVPVQHINGTVLASRGKDSHSDTTKNVIGKKSMSYLVKKMFKSEISATASLRDSLPEARLEKSRMQKIFRAMLNKKIFPQSFTPKATSAKKYLYHTTDSKKTLQEDTTAGSKWDKTDSDCKYSNYIIDHSMIYTKTL